MRSPIKGCYFYVMRVTSATAHDRECAVEKEKKNVNVFKYGKAANKMNWMTSYEENILY